MLDPGPPCHLGQSRSRAVEDDDRLATRVRELMLELTRRVERIDIDLYGTSPCDADERYGKRCKIGCHHRDAVALLYGELGLEIGAKGARQFVDLAKRE